MHSSPAFTLAEFDRVTQELISGIAYLHERHIAHRDLKPLNILFDPAGQIPGQPHGKVKIADFGLARSSSGAEQTQLTRGIGTPAYMAPELFDVESKKTTNTELVYKVDIYALAVRNRCSSFSLVL